MNDMVQRRARVGLDASSRTCVRKSQTQSLVDTSFRGQNISLSCVLQRISSESLTQKRLRVAYEEAFGGSDALWIHSPLCACGVLAVSSRS